MIERFQKLRVPKFQRGSDPLIADKGKEDIENILDLVGVDLIQRQRLAVFNLKGDASKWYKMQFTIDEGLTTTWEEFIRRFDLRYISSAIQAGKEAELLALEQGDGLL